MVGTIFAVGLERVKKGEIEPYGIPLEPLKPRIRISEIEIVGSIDVDVNKVGKTVYDVAKGIYGFKEVPETLKNVRVYPGLELGYVKDIFNVKSLDEQYSYSRTLDQMYETIVDLKPDVIVDVSTTQFAQPFGDPERLKKAVENGRDVVPSQVYAYLAMKYSDEVKPVAYVNCIPAPLANDNAFITLAEEMGGLILGDDGATGATPLTADILEHLKERNRRVLGIAQLNIGGNTDFLALTNERRNKAKEFTKSSIVEDILGYNAPHYIKPTGFLESLGDKKFVALHIEYVSFNGARDELIVNMRINDSPALAGYIVDLVRLSKLALDRGYSGTIYEINAFFMKKPGPPSARNVAKIVAYYNLFNFLNKINALETPETVSFAPGLHQQPQVFLPQEQRKV